MERLSKYVAFYVFFSGRKMKNVFVTCIYVRAKQVLDIANDMPKSQPELHLHKILQRTRLARWPFLDALASLDIKLSVSGSVSNLPFFKYSVNTIK